MRLYKKLGFLPFIALVILLFSTILVSLCCTPEPVIPLQERLLSLKEKQFPSHSLISISGLGLSPLDSSILAVSGVVPHPIRDSGDNNKISSSLELRKLPGFDLTQSFSLPKSLQAIAFNANGKTLALADGSYYGNAFIYIYSISEKKIINSTNVATNWIHDLAYSPDGKIFITCGSNWLEEPGLTAYNSGEIIVWDSITLKKLHVHNSKDDTYRVISFSPDGTMYVIGGGMVSSRRDYGEISLWDVTTNSRKWAKKGHLQILEALSFSSDGAVVASGGMDGELKLWDTNNGNELSHFNYRREGTGRVSSIAFSPDGMYMAVAIGNNNRNGRWGEIRLIALPAKPGNGDFNLGRGGLLKRIDTAFTSVKFSNDGRLLIAGDEAGTVRIWEIR